MEPRYVTEKLTEMVELLSGHYDLAICEDDATMKALREKKKAAQVSYNAIDKRLDMETKERLSDLIGAYEAEDHLLSVYAFLHGLKCGMQLEAWAGTKDEPFTLDLLGKRDYAERVEQEE